MHIGSVDATRGFAKNMWNQLNDGGIWGIPRCGLIYQKRELAKQFVLTQRMPWFEELSVSAEELRQRQDDDHEGIKTLFAAIGVEVVEDLVPMP